MTDESGFEAWYRREQPAVVRALWAMSGDLDLASDLADEAFSRALARWDRVSAMASPGGWVRTVAVNLHKRAARRRALEYRLLRRVWAAAAPAPAPPDLDLWAAVAALPDRQREVIALRYVADCTEAETAAALGISEGAASATLAKARRRLAGQLGADQEVTYR
jgi:RNA polymerase sigma-70 factor (ECF subfamily)